jgi:hypothetical protein
MYPNSFNYRDEDRSISVFEPNLKKITTYRNLPKVDIVEKRLSRKSMSVPIRNCFMLDQYALCTGFFEDNRFAILDSTMNIIKYDADYKPIMHYDKKEDIPYVYNYQSKYAIKPDGTKLVYGSYLGVIFEIYDLSRIPQEVELMHRKEYIYPKYETKKGRNFQVWESEECEIGFYDFYVTNKYIYALISGTSEDIAPSSIYVFDWEGKPIMKFVSDKNLCSIAVDEKNKKIYGVNITMKGVDLVVFNLEATL